MRSANFEWDDQKAATNYAKHGVRFEQAETVFGDPLHIRIADEDHSDEEDRYITIGSDFFANIYVVSHTYREDRIRIISARYATSAEKRHYLNMKHDQIHDEDDLRPEYDFSKGERGKFYPGPGKMVIRVGLEADVAKYYTDAEQVNEALRMLIAEGRAPKPRKE